MTRGKAKAELAKIATMKCRPRVSEGEEDSQDVPLGDEAASTAARKRKAEDSVNDKPTAMAATMSD